MTLDPRITFTRASLGTFYGADGLLKYAAHNLIFQSQTFQTSWTSVNGGTVTTDAATAPDGTTTADRLNHVTAGTANGGCIHQAPGVLAENYLRSVYAKAGTKNFLFISSSTGTTGTAVSNCWFDLATGVVGTKGSSLISTGIESVGNGWYRCWVLALNSAVGATFGIRVAETNGTASCTSPGDIYIWGAQAELVTTETSPRTYIPTTTAAVHTARFDYDPVTHQPKGLLIEETRSNHMAAAQDFTTGSWTKTGVTVTADQTIAPDGTTTADLITASASPATIHQVVGASFAWAVSVFAKKGSSDWFYLSGKVTNTAPEEPKAWFNLATGTVGTIEAAVLSATIQDVGNGWFRCALTRPVVTGSENLMAGICDADNATTVTIGRSIYLWGAQVESGAAFTTSYLPTIASGVRQADVAVMTGTNFSLWYSQNIGTFIAEFELMAAATGTRGIIAADNAGGDRIQLFGSGTDPKLTIHDNSALLVDLDLGTLSANERFKIGTSMAVNDVAGCFDGGTVFTDLAVTMPTPTQLRLGADIGANYLNGWLRKVRFYVVAKSDLELAALTAGDTDMPDVTLAWTTPEDDTTPSFTVTFTGALVGDAFELEIDNDYLFGSLFATEGNFLSTAEVAAGTITMGATIPALSLGTTYYARIKVTRIGTPLSTTYSNAVSKFIAGLMLDLDFETALDSRVTFSRTSLATYYDSAGLLRYAAHNLFLQSQDFNTTWAKNAGATVTVDATTAPDGTTTADLLNHVTAGTAIGGGLSTGASVPPYQSILSVYAKAGSKSFVAVGAAVSTATWYAWFNLTSGTIGTIGSSLVTAGMTSVGSGWYRCWIIVNTASAINTGYIRVAETNGTVNCTSPGDIYLWGAQYEWTTTETAPRTYLPTTTAAVHGPRLDYDPVTHVAKGLLIEEARTNNGGNSDDFAHANWVKTGTTVTGNQIASPDGTTTADLITTSATTATIGSNTGIVATGTAYVQSVFAKKGTSDWIYMVGQSVDVPKVWFNLNTGVVGTIQAGVTSAVIENVGSGWYRCQFADLGNTGSENIGIGVSDADNSAAVTVGRTVYLWGAQSESGVTFASSYIPTGAGSNVARAADIAVMTGANFSSWYNQAQGTFVAEFDLLTVAPTRAVISADNNTGAEQIELYISAGPVHRAYVQDNNVNQVTMNCGTAGAVAVGVTYKLGLSFALNDFAGCVNGGTVFPDTGGTLPTPTQLRIGADGTAADILNGHVRRIRFWNTAKSDAELITLTT